MSECSETIISLFVGVAVGNILWMTVGEKWQDRKAMKRYRARAEMRLNERMERRRRYEDSNE